MANEDRVTSQKGLQLIAKWEGLKLHSYICPAGRRTIGVGHVILPTDTFGDPITEEQAYELLASDVAKFEAGLRSSITVELTQPQWDALISFTFNTGTGGVTNTGVQRAVNEERFGDVRGELMRWCKFKVDGEMRVNIGLQNRRRHEADVFETPEEEWV